MRVFRPACGAEHTAVQAANRAKREADSAVTVSGAVSLQFIAEPKLSDEDGRQAALRRYDIIGGDNVRGFDLITAIIKRTLNVEMAAITFIDADTQWIKSPQGVSIERTDRATAFCNHTIQQTDALTVTDAATDPRFRDNPLVTGALGLRSYCGAPLRTPDGYNVGSICVFGTTPQAFDPERHETLTQFAALVIEQLELRSLARTDALTGLLSRRALDEHLRRAVALPDAPMSLLLIDVDRFKAVNDRYGHPVGDRVLETLARVLSADLRRDDQLARYGGEEFAILLPETPYDEALAIAERLRAIVEAHRLPGPGPERITLSIGVAARRPRRDHVDDWLKAADNALLSAKQSGRNRVQGAPRYPQSAAVAHPAEG